jgi:hypothetical protein
LCSYFYWEKKDIASDTAVNSSLFFIGDKRTVTNGSLVLVQVDYTDRSIVSTVRIEGELVNGEAVALHVGSKEIEKLVSLRDEDGAASGGFGMRG